MSTKLPYVTRSRTWVITLGISLVAVAYVFVGFLPGQRSILELSRQLTEKRRHIIQSDQLIVPLATEKNRLIKIRELTQLWKKEAPDPHDVAVVYSAISGRAREANLQLVRFEPQPARNLHSLRKYTVAMSVQGEFPQMFDFLARLESMPLSMWQPHVRIQRPPGGGIASLQCDLTLSFFGDLNDSAD